MLEEREFSLKEACQSSSYLVNLREIVQTHPSESARNFGLSILTSFNEENGKSLEHLELLAEKNPDIILLHQRIAEFCIVFGKYEKAILHLKKVLDLQDADATSQVWLCLIYHQLGETKKAKEVFKYLRDMVYQIRVNTRGWLDE